MQSSYKLFGIRFINGNYNNAINKLRQSAFMVVPSGPGLATIGKDQRYTKAVQNCDFAIPDSGYMVLLLRWLKGKKIRKFSGYVFLKHFFNDESFEKNELFLIDPTEKDSKVNNEYLNDIGIPIDTSYQYVAPMYGKGDIRDHTLVNKLNRLHQKPKYIMINLGSGIQEPLGYYLKQNIDFKTGIICTGAAIAFFTGAQADVSPTIDYLGLGWLWRCIKNPRVFIPRYIKSFSLIKLILKEKMDITS